MLSFKGTIRDVWHIQDLRSPWCQWWPAGQRTLFWDFLAQSSRSGDPWAVRVSLGNPLPPQKVPTPQEKPPPSPPGSSSRDERHRWCLSHQQKCLHPLNLKGSPTLQATYLSLWMAARCMQAATIQAASTMHIPESCAVHNLCSSEWWQSAGIGGPSQDISPSKFTSWSMDFFLS